MRNLGCVCSVLVFALCSTGCGDDVPLGHGAEGANRDTGGTGGATGGSGGTGSGGSGAGGTSTGGASTGGTGTGGTGTGGTGTGGTAAGGTGGTTGSCPVLTKNLEDEIVAPDARDVAFVSDDVIVWSEAALVNGAIHHADLAQKTNGVLADSTLYPAATGAFDGPDSLATDGTYVYWRAESGRSVWRMPATGGAPVKIASVSGVVSGGEIGLHAVLALSQSEVFWVEGAEPTTPPAGVKYYIYSVPLAGGTAKQLASFENDQVDVSKPFEPLSIEPDGSNLFATVVAGSSSSGLVSLALGGGTPTKLSDLGQYLVTSGNNVLVTTGQMVFSLPKTGGAPTVVTMGLDQNEVFQIHQGIARGGGQVYVSSMGTTFSSGLDCCSCGWVLRAPENGNMAPAEVVWAGTGRPTSIAVGAKHIVTTDIDNGRVMILKP